MDMVYDTHFPSILQDDKSTKDLTMSKGDNSKSAALLSTSGVYLSKTATRLIMDPH
jgi:hypothetical protein